MPLAGPNPTKTLVANSRKQPTSRSLARMGTLGNGNPTSPTARTNSPPVSTLVANSAEASESGGVPFAGGPILPRLRLGDSRREFATSVNRGHSSEREKLHAEAVVVN